jgi:Flp pilus assembly protein TadG
MTRARRGTSTLEFALVFPLLMAILLGAAEFGRAYWTRSSLQTATEDAGRYAMTHSGLSTGQIESYLLTRTGLVDPTAVSVAATTVVDSGVTFVTITASTAFGFLSVLNLPPVTLRATTRVPLAT